MVIHRKIVVTETDETERMPGSDQQIKATLFVNGVPDRLGQGTRCGFGPNEYAAIEDLRSFGHVEDAQDLPVEYR